MRKNRAEKRTIAPDAVYNCPIVAKLINTIMWEGKKILAQNIVYNAFKKIEDKTKKKGYDMFLKSLEAIGPDVELKVRRVAGSNYQVPTPTSPERKQQLALKWLVTYSRERNEKTMADCLANEIIDSVNGIGAAVKKKDDTHRMAKANESYATLKF